MAYLLKLSIRFLCFLSQNKADFLQFFILFVQELIFRFLIFSTTHQQITDCQY